MGRHDFFNHFEAVDSDAFRILRALPNNRNLFGVRVDIDDLERIDPSCASLYPKQSLLKDLTLLSAAEMFVANIVMSTAWVKLA